MLNVALIIPGQIKSKLLVHGQEPKVRELALSTRKNTQIQNVQVKDEPGAGIQLRVNDYIQQLGPDTGCTHRTRTACIIYNCHGLTFASRRAAINNPLEVQKILEEDDYQEIEITQILPGDVAIYYDLAAGQEISHSGIVISPNPSSVYDPYILSKWGDCHEVIHRVTVGPWGFMLRKYFRMFPW